MAESAAISCLLCDKAPPHPNNQALLDHIAFDHCALKLHVCRFCLFQPRQHELMNEACPRQAGLPHDALPDVLGRQNRATVAMMQYFYHECLETKRNPSYVDTAKANIGTYIRRNATQAQQPPLAVFPAAPPYVRGFAVNYATGAIRPPPGPAYYGPPGMVLGFRPAGQPLESEQRSFASPCTISSTSSSPVAGASSRASSTTPQALPVFRNSPQGVPISSPQGMSQDHTSNDASSQMSSINTVSGASKSDVCSSSMMSRATSAKETSQIKACKICGALARTGTDELEKHATTHDAVFKTLAKGPEYYKLISQTMRKCFLVDELQESSSQKETKAAPVPQVAPSANVSGNHGGSSSSDDECVIVEEHLVTGPRSVPPLKARGVEAQSRDRESKPAGVQSPAKVACLPFLSASCQLQISVPQQDVAVELHKSPLLSAHVEKLRAVSPAPASSGFSGAPALPQALTPAVEEGKGNSNTPDDTDSGSPASSASLKEALPEIHSSAVQQLPASSSPFNVTSSNNSETPVTHRFAPPTPATTTTRPVSYVTPQQIRSVYSSPPGVNSPSASMALFARPPRALVPAELRGNPQPAAGFPIRQPVLPIPSGSAVGHVRCAFCKEVCELQNLHIHAMRHYRDNTAMASVEFFCLYCDFHDKRRAEVVKHSNRTHPNEPAQLSATKEFPHGDFNAAFAYCFSPGRDRTKLPFRKRTPKAPKVAAGSVHQDDVTKSNSMASSSSVRSGLFNAVATSQQSSAGQSQVRFASTSNLPLSANANPAVNERHSQTDAAVVSELERLADAAPFAVLSVGEILLLDELTCHLCHQANDDDENAMTCDYCPRWFHKSCCVADLEEGNGRFLGFVCHFCRKEQASHFVK